MNDEEVADVDYKFIYEAVIKWIRLTKMFRESFADVPFSYENVIMFSETSKIKLSKCSIVFLGLCELFLSLALNVLCYRKKKKKKRSATICATILRALLKIRYFS